MELKDMLNQHQHKFKPEAWRGYSTEELEWWSKLLRKRATHRTDEAKIRKDIRDAENYELMLNKMSEK